MACPFMVSHLDDRKVPVMYPKIVLFLVEKVMAFPFTVVNFDVHKALVMRPRIVHLFPVEKKMAWASPVAHLGIHTVLLFISPRIFHLFQNLIQEMGLATELVDFTVSNSIAVDPADIGQVTIPLDTHALCNCQSRTLLLEALVMAG